MLLNVKKQVIQFFLNLSEEYCTCTELKKNLKNKNNFDTD